MPGAVAIDSERLFAPVATEDKIGLAVSGGPDSLALMLLAAEWAKAPGRPSLIVYTVDHGLRPEAADEAAMVVREAERLGLAARSLRWMGDKPASGVQAAARTARYRMMAEAMATDGVEILLTAHHLADQAETVLMRLAHGSGLEGLRGMDAVSFVEGCQIFRPLLSVRPEALGAIVSAAGLTPAADPGNDDSDYERVRWRKLLPALESLGLTPERLGTFSRRVGEASAVITAAAEAAYGELVRPVSAERVELSHGGFATLPPPVAARLLDGVLGVVSGDRSAAPLAALEGLAQRLQAFEPLKTATLHGCAVAADGTIIAIVREGIRTATRKAQDSERVH